MAALGSQSIASSYEQLLHVDRDGGGDTTNHVSVKDGDNETTFGFTIASDALMMTSTNRLEFGDNGTYIHQSADGVLDLVSDTEIEINATTIDMNGALDLSGGSTLGGDIQFSSTTNNIFTTTSDGSDDASLSLSSGGGVGVDRGSYIVSYGNDHAQVGKLNFYAGNTGGGDLKFHTGNSVERIRVEADGGVFAFSLLAASASTDLNIDGSNEIHSVTSSKRYKENIVDTTMDLSNYDKIVIRDYDFIESHGGVHESGIIAEEMELIYPQFVYKKAFEIEPSIKDEEGIVTKEAVYGDPIPESVQYSRLSVLNILKIQSMEKIIQSLMAKVEALEG